MRLLRHPRVCTVYRQQVAHQFGFVFYNSFTQLMLILLLFLLFLLLFGCRQYSTVQQSRDRARECEWKERKRSKVKEGEGAGREAEVKTCRTSVTKNNQRARTHTPHTPTRASGAGQAARVLHARAWVVGAHQPKPKLWMKICYAVLQCIIDAHPSKVGLDLSCRHIVCKKNEEKKRHYVPLRAALRSAAASLSSRPRFKLLPEVFSSSTRFEWRGN